MGGARRAGAEGTTLLLTTQYLEEADRLADDIVVIDHGRAIAHGSPDTLKRQVDGERLEITVATRAELGSVTETLAAIGTEAPTVDDEACRVAVPVAAGTAALVEAVRKLDAAAVTPVDIGVRRPTLDDVFLTLTGHPADATGERQDTTDQKGAA